MRSGLKGNVSEEVELQTETRERNGDSVRTESSGAADPVKVRLRVPWNILVGLKQFGLDLVRMGYVEAIPLVDLSASHVC